MQHLFGMSIDTAIEAAGKLVACLSQTEPDAAAAKDFAATVQQWITEALAEPPAAPVNKSLSMLAAAFEQSALRREKIPTPQWKMIPKEHNPNAIQPVAAKHLLTPTNPPAKRRKAANSSTGRTGEDVRAADPAQQKASFTSAMNNDVERLKQEKAAKTKPAAAATSNSARYSGFSSGGQYHHDSQHRAQSYSQRSYYESAQPQSNAMVQPRFPEAAPGWRTLYDHLQRPYYHNPATGVTQWQRP